MRLNEKFKFGKHKGKSLSKVIMTDPSYVEWCLGAIPGFSISKLASERLDDVLEESWGFYYGDFDIGFQDIF